MCFRYGLCVLTLFLGFFKSTVAQENILISCENSPKEAIFSLPEPLSRWGSVYCTRYGHSVAAKEGWIWTFAGEFFPVHFPAQMVRNNPKLLENTAYFKRIEMISLSGVLVDEVTQKMNQALGVSLENAVESAYRMVLTNQLDETHIALFVQTVDEDKKNKGLWGFWCQDNCEKGTPFLLLNVKNTP